MNAWYLICLPAWLILAVTAAARLADMDNTQWAIRDHVRRLGIMGVGVSSLALLASPFAQDWWRFPEPTWRTGLLAWSWAMVWITTPGTPPWWDFILGVHRQTAEWKGLGLRARIRGELKALRDSFRPRRRRQPMAGPVGPLP